MGSGLNKIRNCTFGVNSSVTKPLLIPWITTSMCMATFCASILFSQIKKEWKCKILGNDKSIETVSIIKKGVTHLCFCKLYTSTDTSIKNISKHSYIASCTFNVQCICEIVNFKTD